MKHTLSQPALREMRRHFANPVRLLAFAGIAIILTLLAPFDTDEMLRALPRFFYWGLLTVLGYTIGYLGNNLADRYANASGPWVRTAIAAPVTAVGVFIVVLLLNYGFLGLVPNAMATVFIAANVFAISAIVSAIMQVAYHQTDSQIGAPPAIHARLPYDKRGDLISISSEDHYIRICTTKGEEMILLRLSDAVREVGDTAGLQVHRSHWIATDHVRMVHKLKDRAEITLSNDRVIPVSRRYLQAVAAAGLFSGKSDG